MLLVLPCDTGDDLMVDVSDCFQLLCWFSAVILSVIPAIVQELWFHMR